MTEHETTADALRKRRSELLDAVHDSLTSRMRLWPHVQPDLPAYESPITGKWIHGRRARREDLKQNRCVEYDPGMKDDAIRRRAESDAKLDAALNESVERMIEQFDRRS
jgi:hypothetical protein